MSTPPGRVPPAWRRLPHGDRGSGTVLVLGVAAVVVLVAGLLGVLAASPLGHARAQAAADLAALAAAERLQRESVFPDATEPVSAPAGGPCVLAAAVAERNGGRTTGCETGASGTAGFGTVTVQVTVDGPAGAARARARAGPSPVAVGPRAP